MVYGAARAVGRAVNKASQTDGTAEPRDRTRVRAEVAERRRERQVITQPLDDIRGWVDTLVYATPEQKDAMVLANAITHSTDSFNTLPRVLITSRQSESGKTTWLDISSYLAQNSWMTDPTQFAMRAKFNEPDRPTPLCDEISKVFGEAGLRGRGSPLYKLLVESYRRSATLSFSVDRAVQEVSSFCVAFLAGLKTAAPDDLRRRSIIILMKPVPPGIELDDSLDPGVEAIGRAHGERLHSWVNSVREDLSDYAKNYRHYHPKLRSRKAQIWAPLFAVAQAAGGDWPERCRRAFTVLALDASEKPVLSPEQQILMDAAELLRSQDAPKYLTSRDLLRYLRSLDERKMYQPQSDRQMAMLMSAALGKAHVLTLPDRRTAKGWHSKIILQDAQALEDLLAPIDDDELEDEYDSFFEEEQEPTTETTETTVHDAA